MDSGKLIPQIFFDILARFVPGAVLLCSWITFLGQDDWRRLLDAVVGGNLHDDNALPVSMLALLFLSFLLGYLLAPFTRGVQRLNEAPPLVTKKTRMRWLAKDADADARYDWLRAHHPDAGTLCAKIRAEFTMYPPASRGQIDVDPVGVGGSGRWSQQKRRLKARAGRDAPTVRERSKIAGTEVAVGRVYLVRHCEAADEGHDPGLTPAGVKQARLLGGRLGQMPVTAVRHGPRRRAAETAALLAHHLQVPARVDDLLDDRTPVPGRGRDGDYPDWLGAWLAAVPAGERDEDGARLSAAVERYATDPSEGHHVLVTHAFVVAWFVRHALGAPMPAWTAVETAPAGLTTIDYRPGRPPHLLGVNDVGHLVTPER